MTTSATQSEQGVGSILDITQSIIFLTLYLGVFECT
jgi:hypothetical protein